MFKDFCARAAAFYGRRSMVLAYSGTAGEFDAAWKRSWDYQRAATFGRSKLHFTAA